MTELPEIGPLARPRRGVSIGALLIWMIVAGAGGAAAWDIYGSDVRSRLGIVREGAQTASASESTPDAPPAGDDMVALVKDLQASQKHTADQLETALQLLSSEQAASKATAEPPWRRLVPRLTALQRHGTPCAGREKTGTSSARGDRAPPREATASARAASACPQSQSQSGAGPAGARARRTYRQQAMMVRQTIGIRIGRTRNEPRLNGCRHFPVCSKNASRNPLTSSAAASVTAQKVRPSLLQFSML